MYHCKDTGMTRPGKIRREEARVDPGSAGLWVGTLLQGHSAGLKAGTLLQGHSAGLLA